MRMYESYSIRGTVVFSPSMDKLVTREAACINVHNGVLECITDAPSYPLIDYKDSLIVPGMVDMHVHAPQYAQRGMGFDLKLLQWLSTYTFPTESKFCDLEYARKIYSAFVLDLVRKGTTHACIFATVHVPATFLLAQLLEEAGITALVGKVCMDREAPDGLLETTSQSLKQTSSWLSDMPSRPNVRPIITPRFVPSCTDELLKGLGKLAQDMNLPIQSHLSESAGEIRHVLELSGGIPYVDIYDNYGLLTSSTIMAHCVFSDEHEIALLKQKGVTIAHCPESNTSITSGIAPIRAFIEAGVKMGLGSDIAGGSKLCMLDVMAEAIKVSKLRSIAYEEQHSLTISEALYMATDRQFFGEGVGFEEGKPFSCIVLDDSHLLPVSTPKERLERMLYLSDDRRIAATYSKSCCLFSSN